MHILKVSLGDRSYPIYIGEGLVDQQEHFSAHIKGDDVFVVTNTTVAPLYLHRVLDQLSEYRCETAILPDGEPYKSLDTANQLYTDLLEKRFGRSSTLIALGGGVVGDITGFVAATYQRGVNFIQVPTTLLAQVDSSVGGKTGVNHPLGKNMVGAFFQPQCVLIDTRTLETLSERELCAGLAEVIKYGLINDSQFFCWIEEHLNKILNREFKSLEYAIRRSCHNKVLIVQADEKERTGQRALLNLGHTFAHAIETGLGYGEWLHGEAVGCGLIMAADLSQRLGWLSPADVERICNLIERAHLPTYAPSSISPERFVDLMSVDKKIVNGQLRLVLLKAIGNAILTHEFDLTKLQATLEHSLAA